MASAQSLPSATDGPVPGGTIAGGAARGAPPKAAAAAKAPSPTASQALVPATRPSEEEAETPFSPQVLCLPVELDITVPIRGFRVRHLLALEPGKLIESQWSSGNDLPLAARDVRLAWTEFEVVESKLAVRVTRMA
jgi:flagellar motor switch/type III secretory pathway protein FliN